MRIPTTLLTLLAVAGSALTASAQTAAEPAFTATCQEHTGSGNKEQQRFCEMRDLTMPAPTGEPLTIAGGRNGGIRVHGWAGPDVRIRAQVQGYARTEAEAQAQVKSVRISTTNNTLHASAPGKDEPWSVSYEVFVPHHTALILHTTNGGINLDNLQGDITFDAVNGGVSLTGLGGQVKGQTVNGGLHLTLTGRQWDGPGLDVQTTNGGIHWKLPRAYSAQLFTSTSVGNIHTSLPVTKVGLLRRELTASLGNGGAPIKASTTNGGIHIEQ